MIKFYVRRFLKILAFFIFFIYDLTYLKRTLNSVQNSNLCIVKPDGIGDYILFRNFLRSIRESKSFGNYKITLICNESLKQFINEFDTKEIDEIIAIKPKSIGTNFKYRKAFLKMCNSHTFDILIYPVVSREALIGDAIVSAFNSNFKIGIRSDNVNTARFINKITDKNYYKLYDIAEHDYFEFNIIKSFIEQFLMIESNIKRPELILRNKIKIHNNYFCVAIGANEKFRKWNINNYSKLIQDIFFKTENDVILIGSEQDVKESENLVSMINNRRLINLVGKTSLAESANIIGNSKLLIGNDSGLIHMAAALKISFICISNGNHFGRFVPYPKEIFDKGLCVFPKKIEIKASNNHVLQKKYKILSNENINSISFEEIKKVIDFFINDII